MKNLFFILCLALFSVAGVLSGTIFDGRRGRGMRGGFKPKSLKSPQTDHINKLGNLDDDGSSKRHINNFKLPDAIAVEKVRRAMKKRLGKREDDQSNERNIWRSHPQMKDYKGPDTTEAVGFDI